MSETFTTTSVLTGLVQTAYDRLLEFGLRSEPLFRSVADKKPAQQAMPGSSVVFEIYQDLAQAITPLNELVDPDVNLLANRRHAIAGRIKVGDVGRALSGRRAHAQDPDVAA